MASITESAREIKETVLCSPETVRKMIGTYNWRAFLIFLNPPQTLFCGSKMVAEPWSAKRLPKISEISEVSWFRIVLFP